MHWRISQIIAIIIFLASVVQLYLEKNIAYLILALGSFASLMTWLKGPVVLAAEKLNDPNMDMVDKSIEALVNIIKKTNSRSARWELVRVMQFHQNPEVSRKAAIALAEIKDKRAIKGLIAHLPHVGAIKGFDYVKEIDDKKLRFRLIERYKTKKDIPVELVARLGSNDSISFLCNEIQSLIKNQDKTYFTDDTIIVIRYLGEYKVFDAVDLLIELFKLVINYRINGLSYFGGIDEFRLYRLWQEIISSLNKMGYSSFDKLKNILIDALNVSDDEIYLRAEKALDKIVPEDEFKKIIENATYKPRFISAGTKWEDGA